MKNQTSMAQSELRKIGAEPGAVCALFPLSAEGRALLDPELSARAFIDRLCAEGLWLDAVRFLAHGLPNREAVWWACLAARANLDDPPPEALRQAVETAEAWVYGPNEDNRRAAMQAATAAGTDNPAGWAARGAFWSGGSLTPPDTPVVPPGETLTAQAVAGAVCLAAVQREPARAAEKYQGFIAQGLDIAAGGNGRLKSA